MSKFRYPAEVERALGAKRAEADGIIEFYRKHPLSARVVEHDGHAEIVLSWPTGDPASLYTTNIWAARRLAKLVGDMRVLVQASGMEKAAGNDFGRAGNRARAAKNAERDALVRKIAGEERALKVHGHLKRAYIRMEAEGFAIPFDTFRKIAKEN